jgi:hypothetical protein
LCTRSLKPTPHQEHRNGRAAQRSVAGGISLHTHAGWLAIHGADGLAARGRVYLVNDAGKADLLRRLEQWRRWINRLYLLWFVPMVVAHETRTSGDLVEALSHAIGISYGVVAAAIVALPVILISVGTPALQLLAIRSILARAIALPTRVGLWERFFATPESLARSNSYLGLTFILLTCVVYGSFSSYSVLRSPEADWSILLPLTIGSGFILLAIAFMAAFLFKLRAGGSERDEG